MNLFRRTALRLFYIQFYTFKKIKFIHNKINLNLKIYENMFKISMNLKTEEDLFLFLKNAEIYNNKKNKSLDDKRGKHMKILHKKAKEMHKLNPEKTYHQCLKIDVGI